MIAPLLAAVALRASDPPKTEASVIGRAPVVPLRPGSLAVAREGGLYLADDKREQILKYSPGGRFSVIAGNGRRGFSGDGGRALGAELNDPGGLAVAPDGSLYFADSGNNRVRRISPAGRISTVAGDGTGGWTAGGLPARAASILSPAAVTFGPGGRPYIAAQGWGEVLRVNRDGTLSRIAGTRRRAGVYGVDGPAVRASADGVNALAFDEAGNLYLAGFNTKTLLMIDRGGRMQLPAGRSSFYPRGDGGLATTSTGRVLAIDTQNIVALAPSGLTTVFSFVGRTIAGITGFLPAGVAVSADGTIFTDTAYGNGWSSGSGIISIAPSGKTTTLWKGSH